MLPRLTARERNEAILKHGRVPNPADRYLFLAMDGHIFDEGEIVRGMKLLFNEWSRNREANASAPKYPTLGDSMGELCNFLWENPRPITQAHSDKGIAWWRTRCFCKGGTGEVWREDQFTANMGALEREVIEGFTHFEFVGYEERNANANASGYRGMWLPTYRVHGAGKSFDYIYGAWQSGSAGLEIV